MKKESMHTEHMKKAAEHHKQAEKHMERAKHWIGRAIEHPGALRAELHVKKGEKIPTKKLEAAAKKPGTEGRRARLAETLRSFPKK
jgi:nitrogen fixation protein FixH